MTSFIIIAGLILWVYVLRSFGDFERKIDILQNKVQVLEKMIHREAGENTKINVSQNLTEPVVFNAVSQASPAPDLVVSPAAEEDINKATQAMLHTPVTATSSGQSVHAAALKIEAKSEDSGWWFSQSILTKLGAVLVLISIGSFLGYAIVQGWIGPVLQVLMAFVAGASIGTFGVLKIEKEVEKGSLFIVLGSSIVALSLLVATHLYSLISPVTGSILMWVPIVIVAYLSILYKYEKMAVFSLLLAFITPALVGVDTSSMGIFAYLGLVSAGASAVAVTIGSRKLIPISIIITAFWTFDMINMEDKYLAFGMVSLIMIMFTLANMIAVVREKESQYKSYAITASVGGLWLLVWISELFPGLDGVPFLLFWSTFFIVGAYLTGRILQSKIIPRVYVAISAVFLSIATMHTFDGAILALVTLSQVTALVLTYLIGLREVEAAKKMLLVYIYPVLLSIPFFGTTPSAGDMTFMSQGFIVLLSFSLVFIGVASQFARIQKQHNQGLAVQSLLYIVGGFYFNLLLANWLPLYLLTIVWLLEISVLSIYNLVISKCVVVARSLMFVYPIPIMMAVSFLTDQKWSDGVVHSAFFVLVTAAVSLFVTAFYFGRYDKQEESIIPHVLYCAVTFFGVCLIWLTAHAALPAGIATMTSLVIYTAAGLFLYIRGIRTYDNFTRILGLVLIGAVVTRLMLVEIHVLSVPLRIAAFMVIGLMLLSTAFISKGSHKNK